MASKYASPTEKSEKIFTDLEDIIFSTFQKLLECVRERRDKLLTEVVNLRCEYDTNIASVLQEIEELEAVKQGIESLAVNQSVGIIQASISPVVNEIKELEKQIPLPNSKFECDINPIQDQVKNLGKILTLKKKPVIQAENYTEIKYLSPKYELPPPLGAKPPPLPPSRPQLNHPSRSRSQTSPSKLPPLNISKSLSHDPHLLETKSSTFCYGERMLINNPKSICYDRLHKNVFVISFDDTAIYVFTSKGKLETKFGKNELQAPVGICTTEKHCYIADEKLNTIFVFSTTNLFHLVKKRLFERGSVFGKIGVFRGMAVDQINQIHVVDNENNRITVLDLSLSVKRAYGHDFLHHPKDIHVSNWIYVLDLSYPHCLHGVSCEGQRILSIVDHNEIDTPLYFCVTPEERFIISGVFEENLKVFSESGASLYTTEVASRKPRGVCLLDNGRVACAYAEGAFVLYNILI